MRLIYYILRFLKFSRLAVLLMTIDGDKKQYELYFIRKKKSQLDFATKETVSDPEIIAKLVKSNPVYLCIHGTGIIERVTDNKEDNPAKVESQTENDLFSMVTSLNNGLEYCVYVKKSKLDEILNDLNQIGIKVHNVTFAINSVVQNQNLFSESEFSFVYNKKKYFFNNRELQEAKKCEIVDVDSEWVFCENQYSASRILAISVGIQFYLKEAFNFGLNDLLISNIKEFVYAKFLKVLSLYSLILLLFVLMANFVVNESLEKEELNLKQEIGKNQRFREEFEKSSDKIKARLHLLTEMEINRFIPVYHLVDSIGYLSGGELKFSRLDINPLAKDIRNSEKVEIENGKIQINGEVDNPERLGEFIEKISAVPWVVGIEKQYYQQETNSNSAIFELTVNWKDTSLVQKD